MKNDKLQLYVKEQFGKELVLKLDVKNRWRSMCDMLERFLHVQQTVAKALIDFNITLSLNRREIDLLRTLTESLKVIKCAQILICSLEATVLTAEGLLDIYSLN